MAHYQPDGYNYNRKTLYLTGEKEEMKARLLEEFQQLCDSKQTFKNHQIAIVISVHLERK